MKHLFLITVTARTKSKNSFALLYLVTVVILLSYPSCQSSHPTDKPWSKTYEKHLFSRMDSAEKQRIPDERERHKIISFLINRFKRDLPMGIESVSQDSFKTLATKIGLEYAHETEPDLFSDTIRTTVKWSVEVEQQLKVSFLKGYKAKGPYDAKQKCDCIVAKLKEMYPDSLTIPLADQTMASALKPCF